jgi:hypothetical protein
MQDIRVAAVTLTPHYLNVWANCRSICDWSERAAKSGAKLVLFPGADHGISQNKHELYELVREWFLKNL